MMQTSAAGVSFIKGFESFFSKPYLCPADVPTIGYGTTYYNDGRKVTLKDAPINEAQASALLAHQLASEYEPGVLKFVKVELLQREFDALVSFAYNVGFGSVKLFIPGLSTSTLLRKLNADDKAGAAAEFAKWNRGGGKVLNGLTRRRHAEEVLFSTGKLELA